MLDQSTRMVTSPSGRSRAESVVGPRSTASSRLVARKAGNSSGIGIAPRSLPQCVGGRPAPAVSRAAAGAGAAPVAGRAGGAGGRGGRGRDVPAQRAVGGRGGGGGGGLRRRGRALPPGARRRARRRRCGP